MWLSTLEVFKWLIGKVLDLVGATTQPHLCLLCHKWSCQFHSWHSLICPFIIKSAFRYTEKDSYAHVIIYLRLCCSVLSTYFELCITLNFSLVTLGNSWQCFIIVFMLLLRKRLDQIGTCFSKIKPEALFLSLFRQGWKVQWHDVSIKVHHNKMIFRQTRRTQMGQNFRREKVFVAKKL